MFDNLLRLREHSRIIKRVHLAIMLGQSTLVVERVHMAGATLHEQEDHSLGTRRKMRLLLRQWIHRGADLPIRQGRRRQEAESAADRFERLPSIGVGMGRHNQSR